MKYCLLITYILINLTIAYSQDTLCSSANNQKLFETITHLEKGSLEKKGNLIFLLNNYPLNGFYNQKAYDSLNIIIQHILGKYGKVFTSSSNEALEEVLQEKPPRYDVVFLILQVSHESTGGSGVPFAVPMGTGVLVGITTGYLHFEHIRFVAIELKSHRTIWDYTLKKGAGWFSSGNRARINEYTDIGRLSDRVGFDHYAKKGIYKLNTELKRFWGKVSKSKKNKSQ